MENHYEGAQVSQADYFEWARKRAEAYLEKGDVKIAIDSIVSDLQKDKTRPEDQRGMIIMMGMELKNKVGLTKEDVRDFINDFSVDSNTNKLPKSGIYGGGSYEIGEDKEEQEEGREEV